MSSFRINRVYTRTGDEGETALVGGQRVAKSDLRVEAYGEVDELNSVLALCKEHITPEKSGISEVATLPEAAAGSLRALIEFLQQELFDLGAELACSPENAALKLPRASASQVARLETWCDHFNQGLPELQSFIVPGGSRLSAFLHQARTVCRRAERRVIALQQMSRQENPEIIRYLNRLSDFLFILVRWVLAQQQIEPGLWTAPEKRSIPQF